jgi:hypothetical protein
MQMQLLLENHFTHLNLSTYKWYYYAHSYQSCDFVADMKSKATNVLWGISFNMSEDERKAHDSKSSEEISSKLPVQKHSIKHKVTEKTNHEQSFYPN